MSNNFNWGYSKRPLLSNVNIESLENKVNQNTNDINDIKQEQLDQNTNITTNTNNIATNRKLLENKQDLILIHEYKLRDIYNGAESIFVLAQSGSGWPETDAPGVRFNTIHTNLTVNPNSIYTIKTTGDLGNNSSDMWYSAIQTGCYVANNKLVVFVNKLHNNNFDSEVYKDNIYIVEWRL